MKSYEFISNSGKHFIKNIFIYNGLSIEKSCYKDTYTVKLYFLKKYDDCDGFISIDRDYDCFEFPNEKDANIIYNELKQLLKNN